MKIVVQDASTLLNLLKSGLLRSAAKALGLHILTTDLVADEIREPRTEFDQAVAAGQVEIRDCTAAELQEIVEEQRGARELSLPDMSVITLAIKTGCPLGVASRQMLAESDFHLSRDGLEPFVFRPQPASVQMT